MKKPQREQRVNSKSCLVLHYKCLLNLHSTPVKVEVTHRRAFFPFLAKFTNKKNWLDSFLALTSCQCGFVLTTATCTSKITACRQMWRGGRRSAQVKVSGVFWILVPCWWLQCLWWWPWWFHPYFDVHSCEAVLPLHSFYCFHHLLDGMLL